MMHIVLTLVVFGQGRKKGWIIDLDLDLSQCRMNCKPTIINTLYTKLNNITFTKWDNSVNSVIYLEISLSHVNVIHKTLQERIPV